MKVLLIVGNPAGQYGREHLRELVCVWQDNDHGVHVNALAPEYEAFAQEARRRIDERLASKTPFALRQVSFSKPDDDLIIDGLHRSTPEKDDFLGTLGADTRMWDREIAGYEPHLSASQIIEA